MRRPRDSAVLRRWLNGTCAVLVLGLVSCGANPAAEPVPTGVPSSPTASAEAQVSSSASQEALNAEAEQVFKAFFIEDQKVFSEGGASELPESITRYITGEYAQTTLGVYRLLRERGWRSAPDTSARFILLNADAASSLDTAVVASLRVCLDYRGSHLVDAQNIDQGGNVYLNHFFFQRDEDGLLKIAKNQEEVIEEC